MTNCPPRLRPVPAADGHRRPDATVRGGFQGEVTVRAGTGAINGWTVRMTLASGQSITNLWNGVNTGTSGAVSVRNAPYNGNVAVNGTTTFGYVANGNGAAAPTAVTCTSP